MTTTQTRFPQFAIVAIVVGLVVLMFLLVQSRRSFPSLSPGYYRGKATLLGGSEQPVTLFMERWEEGRSTLLVTVMSQGWKPQTVALTSMSVNGDRVGPFEPLLLRGPGGVFTLYGTELNGDYSGYVMNEQEQRGTWVLERVSDDRFDLDASSVRYASDDLGEWLSMKNRVRVLKRRMSELEQQLAARRDKFEKLVKFIEEENMLRVRAESRREVLKREVEQARAERERVNHELATLINDLSVQRRVSHRGRAVELARRVANRENKWYLANWKAEEDRTGLSANAGDEIQVDFKKLDAAFAKANEILALQQEVAMEREKIRDLNSRLGTARSVEADIPAEEVKPPEGRERKPLPPARKPGERESLWDRLFG